jgi:hypothetical protein
MTGPAAALWHAEDLTAGQEFKLGSIALSAREIIDYARVGPVAYALRPGGCAVRAVRCGDRQRAADHGRISAPDH